MEVLPLQTRRLNFLDSFFSPHFSEWQRIVEKNIINLAKEDTQYLWPKDSLFRYFLIMEALQENLQEREELLDLAGKYCAMSVVFVCIVLTDTDIDPPCHNFSKC